VGEAPSLVPVVEAVEEVEEVEEVEVVFKENTTPCFLCHVSSKPMAYIVNAGSDAV